jgi:hypothetical protein
MWISAQITIKENLNLLAWEEVGVTFYLLIIAAHVHVMPDVFPVVANAFVLMRQGFFKIQRGFASVA